MGDFKSSLKFLGYLTQEEIQLNSLIVSEYYKAFMYLKLIEKIFFVSYVRFVSRLGYYLIINLNRGVMINKLHAIPNIIIHGK